MKNFSVVVAVTQKGGIGLNATIPWKLPTDLKFFKSVTTKTQDEKKQNAVIMGRKTWDSIPAKFRPLPGRLNIVLTRNIQEHISACSNSNVRFASTFQQALEVADDTDVEGVFVIGGSHVYKECLSSPLCSKIYLTQVLRDINCDVFFPPLNPSEFRLETVGEVQVENSVPFQFNTYIRTESDTNSLPISTDVAPVENVEEMQYLDLVRRVIDTGVHKGDRTGTGTLSLFGIQSRYNLRGGRMPLLTTKRVFWRGVVEELLWLIRGCTDSKQLAEKKVSIWDGNGSRAFLDKLGFTARAEGDLGPVYGFQWRHFGAEYTTCSADYTGQGVDQLAQVVHALKHNPDDRRILMSAWNVKDLKAMALPPCHVLCQFYVANGELSCQMYQRSCDLGLGVPFNIASYSLLTHMLAHVCGLRPGEFVHTLGDAHVYSNHVQPLTEQLKRTPRAFPSLSFARQVADVNDFTADDFILEGYQPHEAIKMAMAV